MHRAEIPFRCLKYWARSEATRLLPTPPLPCRERCTVVPARSPEGFELPFREFAMFVPLLRRFEEVWIIWAQTVLHPAASLNTRIQDDAHLTAAGSEAGPRVQACPIFLPACPARMSVQ